MSDEGARLSVRASSASFQTPGAGRSTDLLQRYRRFGQICQTARNLPGAARTTRYQHRLERAHYRFDRHRREVTEIFKGPPRLGGISYTQAAKFPWPWLGGVSRSVA